MISKLQPVSSGSVFPKTMGLAALSQVSVTTNTFYTVVNITGKGVLSRVSLVNGTYGASNLTLNITIDGVLMSLRVPTTGSYTLGFQRAASITGDLVFDLLQNLQFNTSLKVEVANVISTTSFNASVEYGLF